MDVLLDLPALFIPHTTDRRAGRERQKGEVKRPEEERRWRMVCRVFRLTSSLLLFPSLAQAQLADQREITIAILAAKVIEQTRPLADHHEQAAPADVVLLLCPEILCQLGNTPSEQSHLHFRRARIGLLSPVLIDDLGLAFLRNGHLVPCRLRRVQLLPRLC